LRPSLSRSDIHRRLGLERGRYALVTLHRPRLVDGPLLDRALASLKRLSRELAVVFPMHPRTRARIGVQSLDSRLLLIEPVGYLDFLALQSSAAAVVTDSGGVQEESTFLGVPCFTLRETTERPITIERGTNRLLGLEVERIEEVPRLLEEDACATEAPEGWEGLAAGRIVEVLGDVLVSGH
jgi:UDP-N-acetylglucosamine 2-epimerase (non-hydrolysing)